MLLQPLTDVTHLIINREISYNSFSRSGGSIIIPKRLISMVSEIQNEEESDVIDNHILDCCTEI